MKIGCAAIFQNHELLKCLPNESSIYSAVVTTIDQAINFIANHKSSKFIIYSESKSVFLSLLNKMNSLSKNNSIILTWIPSHIIIHRNERADRTVTKTVLIDIFNTKIHFTDLKPTINKFIHDKWQKSWDYQIHKYYHIQDIISDWPAANRGNKKEVIFPDFTLATPTFLIHTF